MDISHIFNELNDAQREAVAAPASPMLVLAGAGSGKTRVLTSRIAYLVEAQQVSPLSVLAVTFTNKASREMRHRIEDMLGIPMGGMWIGTFHSLSHRLLRQHYKEANLPQAFQILDSDDQLRMIRRSLKELALDEAYWPPKQLQWYINGHKEEGRRPQHVPPTNDAQRRTLLAVYSHYESLCQRFGLIDFSELLLRAYELLRNNDVLRERYQGRFQHVLVDEFQDTNSIQYLWLKILVQKSQNLFAVGDDDQSIYGWRGAKVENILQFEKDFPGAKVIRLEQNYRSTTHILDAANAVIKNNDTRLGKNLWSAGEEGQPVKLYTAYNEQDEARFVIDQIQGWVNQGGQRSEVAILYRSNAQSRVFEERLLNVGMPYRVYGGLRFFERAEIKDALAYLRVCTRREDDPSFERIVNTPPRGIGNKTVEVVREHARLHQLSMWDACNQLIAGSQLSSRAQSALATFVNLIQEISRQIADQDLYQQIEIMLELSKLIEHFQKDKGEKGQARVENLQELITAARGYEIDETEDDLPPLSSFLAHAALEAGEGQAEEWEDCVQLMSLHSAKGLEFPMVFLTGLEEGLFPHQRSLDEGAGRLEEERRLCYVGMTRAMQQLWLSHAELRRLYGAEKYTSPSRFLGEIPSELLVEIRARPKAKYSAPRREHSAWVDDQSTHESGISVGANISHPKFGDGVVVNLEGQGEYARIQINFSDVGSKWLVLAYANLSLME
ncbi:MAG: DNA helicase II [Gammaproteobacteria bacterium]|nr:DNA helicase II [Gammaproteobacteria bacterium]